MNERIQKLYDQADKFATENRTQTISGPGNNYFELFHEKFAELIVRDCVEQIIIRERTDGEWYQDDIFKHFGVEEDITTHEIKLTTDPERIRQANYLLNGGR